MGSERHQRHILGYHKCDTNNQLCILMILQTLFYGLGMPGRCLADNQLEHLQLSLLLLQTRCACCKCKQNAKQRKAFSALAA